MKWKEKLEKYEHDKDWDSAIEFMRNVINNNPNEIEAYIQIIYLLHNILIEEDYPEIKHDYMAMLLKQYFDDSYKKFCDDVEYLFFIGKILYIAEWYFGINDDIKPIRDRLAFTMQKKATQKEPNNILFEWAYRLSLGDPLAGYLADQILRYGYDIIVWLKSKGFPGRYILECLEQNKKDYTMS